MFILLWGVCQIVLFANLTLSSSIKPSAMFALVSDLIVRIVLSTWPVPVCKFGVHLMRFIFSRLQNYLNSLLLKQLPCRYVYSVAFRCLNIFTPVRELSVKFKNCP